MFFWSVILPTQMPDCQCNYACKSYITCNWTCVKLLGLQTHDYLHATSPDIAAEISEPATKTTFIRSIEALRFIRILPDFSRFKHLSREHGILCYVTSSFIVYIYNIFMTVLFEQIKNNKDRLLHRMCIKFNGFKEVFIEKFRVQLIPKIQLYHLS